MSSLIPSLLSTLNAAPSTSRYWVAYSGGVDSHTLLHALATHRDQLPTPMIHAVHINHGLQTEATLFASHCETFCAQWAIPCEVIEITISADHNVEALARQSRYKALAALLQPGDTLLTAHHRDDQAETLLLQLARGCGVKGLAAMPVCKAFSQGHHVRPLLDCSREAIHQYARDQGLSWVNDPMNTEQRFDRNFLRQTILPALQARWPAILKTLSRTAKHCSDATILLDDVAENDAQTVQWRTVLRGSQLAIPGLLSLSSERQRNLLRYLIQKSNLPLPPQHKLAEIQTQLLTCRPDASPLITWSGAEVRRYRSHLFLLPPLAEHDARRQWPWDLRSPFTLPNNLGVITPADLFDPDTPMDPTAYITFRQGGERCRLPHRTGSTPLKKLFQEWGIPPWLRDRIPLVYSHHQLAGIAGYAQHCKGAHHVE